ncbi:MAG: hypothetical protein DRP97_00500 [Candidatus Latescibacterota bacterium]|nr:MAG: hypothetical protein DRP97_00500 [Candidatus Latescibacterota bacterium]
MSDTWKQVLSGYINNYKDKETGQETNDQYLVITNMSDNVITLQPKGKIFMKRTPTDRKAQYPNIPDFSQSVRVEDVQQPATTPVQTDNYNFS